MYVREEVVNEGTERFGRLVERVTEGFEVLKANERKGMSVSSNIASETF